MEEISIGVLPGGQSQAMTPSGVQVLVTCPEGSKSGDQIQSMAPATQGASIDGIDPAATAQYEEWLTAATRIVIRNQGGSKKPVVETIALDVYGKTADGATGLFGTLTLEVSVDPEKKDLPNSAWSLIRDAEPYWVFNAELKLPDGRVVMSAASAGMRIKGSPTSGYVQGTGYEQAAPGEGGRIRRSDQERGSLPLIQVVRGIGGGPKPIEMQVMDRDGPVCMTAERPDLTRWLCDPLVAELKTRVWHPQSADETLRQGYQLSAPGSINGTTKTCHMLNLLLVVPTCGFGVLPLVCFRCCFAPPDVHFELKELRSGGAVEGARCTERAGSSARWATSRPTGSQRATRSSSLSACHCRSARTRWPSLSTNASSLLLCQRSPERRCMDRHVSAHYLTVRSGWRILVLSRPWFGVVTIPVLNRPLVACAYD